MVSFVKKAAKERRKVVEYLKGGAGFFGKRAFCAALAVCLFGVCLSGCQNKADAGEADADTSGQEGQQECYADIDMQDYGVITLKLEPEEAPVTTENFIKLAKDGFYDGLTFHRIIEGFMMQGGDPDGNGTGGSEQTIEGEFSNNGHDNSLSHTRGAVSMARSRDYNSASSQFFIVHEDSTFLDGEYAVFGYVTEGMDIVDEICTSAQPADGDGAIPPEAQPVIRTVTIRME